MHLKKLNTNLKTAWGMMAGFAIAAMVLIGGGFVPAPTLASPSETSPIATPRPPANPVLEKGFKQAKDQLKQLAKKLKLMNKKVAKAQNFIKKQAAKGKDVATIQAALNTFKAQLNAAQAAQTTAQQILAAKAGFNKKGKVTNPQQAQQTVRNARQALEQAKNILQQAVADFDRAMQDYKQP
ncbi:MAG: hypothetical protein HC875_30255 [Anaerolineales bacterium]|nr:hypothetical protein [Anaerolineales bacterium]